MKALAVVVVLVAVHAREAWPCSISAEPAASVFGPQDGKPRGHRPWIRLHNVKPTTKVTIGTRAQCAPRKICSADTTLVAIERDGAFVRPKIALPSGAVVVVTAGATVLDTFIVTSVDPKPLPAWSGLEKPMVTMEGEGLCSPAGPVVKTKVLPTSADLSNAVLLVYTKRPDPKRPHVGIAAIYMLGVGELALHSGLGNVWLPKRPTRLWTALSDGDGNVGPIVEHAFDARADVFGPPDQREPRGRRPWIRLYGTKGPIALQTVSASCDPSAVCSGTVVELDREGDYARPKAALAAGSRLQISTGNALLANVAIRAGAEKPLPVIPFSLEAPVGTGSNSCPAPNMVGPDLALTDVDQLVALLYTSKPDPAKPLAKLAAVLRFDGRWLDFGLGLGSCVFAKLPPAVWTILATDEGAIGTPVEHDLRPPKTGTGLL